MDEAYTYQLWKMMDIQREIKKLQSVSGVLSINDEIQLKSEYFKTVASLFDSWFFKPIKNDMYDHKVWGYINKVEFNAYCTDHELVDLLADNMKNFAKKIPPAEKTTKLEPVFSELLEKVFGKGNA